MRTANYIRQNHPANGNMSFALSSAWWFESFRDAISNGFARFTYRKMDGTTRTALGTRAESLIPLDKVPNTYNTDEIKDTAKSIPYFDLDKNEWRSFNVLNFVSLDKVWYFNDPLSLRDSAIPGERDAGKRESSKEKTMRIRALSLKKIIYFINLKKAPFLWKA